MILPLYIPWDEKLVDYNFGNNHPLAPIRVQLAMKLALDLNIISTDELVGPVTCATREQLMRVHTAEYLDAVASVGESEGDSALEYGLGTSDNPVFRDARSISPSGGCNAHGCQRSMERFRDPLG